MVVIGVVTVVNLQLGYNKFSYKLLCVICSYFKQINSMNSKFIFSAFLIYLFSSACLKKEPMIIFESKTSINKKSDSIITLIFKRRSYINDTIKNISKQFVFKQDLLFYSKKADFRTNNLYPNNFFKNDTIIIKSIKSIILTHGFGYHYTSFYEFKPGNVVNIDYPNDKPFINIEGEDNGRYFNILNKLLNNDKLILDDNSLFFLKNKRYRNSDENKIFLKNYYNIINRKILILDSLLSQRAIPKTIERLYSIDFTNQLNFKNYKNNNLEVKLDLSLPSNRYSLINDVNLLSKPIIVKQKNGSHIDYERQFKTIYDLKKIDFNNKEFLLYYYLNKISEYSSFDKNQFYFNKFSKLFPNSLASEDLKQKLFINQEKVKNETKKIIFANSKNEKFDLDFILDKYFGNVIYIDFWASWCAPCRAEMPDSKKLQEEYKNKKVTFIYVSIDGNKDKWQNASQIEKIPTVNNLLALNYPTALFYKELKLNFIPRYLIYNKIGKLVQINAPSPSSKIIKKQLDIYLQQ